MPHRQFSKSKLTMATSIVAQKEVCFKVKLEDIDNEDGAWKNVDLSLFG